MSEIKKVVATIEEIPQEPEYWVTVRCPYCQHRHSEEIYSDNYTTTIECENPKCKKKFKVKIPKYSQL